MKTRPGVFIPALALALSLFAGSGAPQEPLPRNDQRRAFGHIVDYDGDGTSDPSAFSIETRTLHGMGGLERSWKSAFAFRLPVPADYNGDGKTEIAFFDGGMWHVYGHLITRFGEKGDWPVPGDYDGDGKADLALWRPGSGVWLLSDDLQTSWGDSADIPVPQDYDGDGRTDIAVWRPKEGAWYIKYSGGEPAFVSWGSEGDIPVPGDYDGDGKCDPAVWRPKEAKWRIKCSGGEPAFVSWGSEGDIPVPGDYDGDGKCDPAVWRPKEAKWHIRGREPVSLGRPADIPLAWNIWILWAKKLVGPPSGEN